MKSPVVILGSFASALLLYWADSPPSEGVIRYEVRHGQGADLSGESLSVIPAPAKEGWVPRVELPAAAPGSQDRWVSVTAINAAGAGEPMVIHIPEEVEPDAEETDLPPNEVPSGFRMEATLQTSDDLKSWEDQAVHFFRTDKPKKFARLRVEMKPLPAAKP